MSNVDAPTSLSKSLLRHPVSTCMCVACLTPPVSSRFYVSVICRRLRSSFCHPVIPVPIFLPSTPTPSLVVAQIRGRETGYFPPYPLRYLPCILLEREEAQLLPSSTCVLLYLRTQCNLQSLNLIVSGSSIVVVIFFHTVPPFHCDLPTFLRHPDAPPFARRGWALPPVRLLRMPVVSARTDRMGEESNPEL